VAQACCAQLTAEGLLEPCPMAMAACAVGPEESVRALACAENGRLELPLRRHRQGASVVPPPLKRWGQRPSFAGAGPEPEQGPGAEAGAGADAALLTALKDWRRQQARERRAALRGPSTTAPCWRLPPAAGHPSQPAWRENSGIGRRPRESKTLTR